MPAARLHLLEPYQANLVRRVCPSCARAAPHSPSLLRPLQAKHDSRTRRELQEAMARAVSEGSMLILLAQDGVAEELPAMPLSVRHVLLVRPPLAPGGDRTRACVRLLAVLGCLAAALARECTEGDRPVRCTVLELGGPE